MCGRITLITPIEEIARLFDTGVISAPALDPSYNVPPSSPIYVVVEDSGGERRLETMTWGFVPGWIKDLETTRRPINARGETVATNGFFRSAFRRHRCLIPADGFYEWKRDLPEKQPYYFYREDGRPLAFAGLWDHWSDASEEGAPGSGSIEFDSCAIITTEANEMTTEVHNRMPVILEESDWDAWLDPNNQDVEGLQELLQPAGEAVLDLRPVNPAVGNVRNNSPELIDRYETLSLPLEEVE